ncbi:PREDICTED: uncharacterized protein LOC109153653 isoform X2 [Ipomoea nil]|uniref:uncharacterized protein LOC109153653 isoform X2 n=1 Tax=Ipomoea nil TaxID=35883 RepID=UPI000901196D|nr:PREDICTED: uncharacterized protein LOC109153653 isoform X2 [Ipomoea nil]
MAAGNYYSLLNCSIVANLLLLLLLPTIYTRAAAGAVMMGGCRTAAECATAGGGVVIGEEFVMMDSETNKRLHERATNSPIYASLQKGPICHETKYQNCFDKPLNLKIKCGNYTRDCSGSG